MWELLGNSAKMKSRNRRVKSQERGTIGNCSIVFCFLWHRGASPRVVRDAWGGQQPPRGSGQSHRCPEARTAEVQRTVGAFLQTKDGVSDQSKQMNQDTSLSSAQGLSGPRCAVSHSSGAVPASGVSWKSLTPKWGRRCGLSSQSWQPDVHSCLLFPTTFTARR